MRSLSVVAATPLELHKSGANACLSRSHFGAASGFEGFCRTLRLQPPEVVRGRSELINNGITMAATPDRGPIFETGGLDLSCSPDFEQIVAFIDPDALPGL